MDLPKVKLINLLHKVRGRVDKPSKWVSYWWQSEDGKRLGIDGAIWWASEGDEELAKQAFEILASHSGENDMWLPYDRVCRLGTHKEMLAMLDQAIACATGE